MRKALTFVLTLAMAAFFATPLAAQRQVLAGSIAGRSVNVAGSGMAGERVELLAGTTVVNTTETNGLGEWSFKNVQPGAYIVRMNVRGRIAGVRVSIETGQVVTGTMIVVPAATASTQLGVLSSLLSLAPVTAAAAAQTVSATVDSAKTTELSPKLLVEILTKLSPEERKTFAAEVVDAIKGKEVGSVTFAQYQKEFEDIAKTGTVPPVASFSPPTKVSGN